jgi:hypothetical protein
MTTYLNIFEVITREIRLVQSVNHCCCRIANLESSSKFLVIAMKSWRDLLFRYYSVAAPGLRIWGGIWGANSYFGGQDRIFKKVLLFAHAVVTGLLSPPPGDSPPSQKGAIFLGIPPPGDEYLRNIAPPPQRGECPRNIAPPLGYSPPPIYAMWFIQIISWYFHLISALRPIQTGRYLATRREFSVFNDI